MVQHRNPGSDLHQYHLHWHTNITVCSRKSRSVCLSLYSVMVPAHCIYIFGEK